MLNIINFKLNKAIFVSEGKSRFICNILYNEKILECYVPITCKLSSLLSLEGKEILIRETTKVICTPKVRHFWRCIFFMGKTGRKNKVYSAEFKIGVIMDMREHHLGYRETARKYDLVRQSETSAASMLHRWERIYLEEGAEGLMKERRGRACSTSGTRKGRPPKLDKKVEEDLIAENQRLRMEIEYLKKLDALVQKRLQEEKKKQQ